MIVLNSTKTIELNPSFYGFTKVGKIKKGSGLKLDSMKWSDPVCIRKSCSKCKVEKRRREFGRDKQKKDGLKSQCKECEQQYAKKYYQRTGS